MFSFSLLYCMCCTWYRYNRYNPEIMASVFLKKSVTHHRNVYPKILEYADENREEGFFVDVSVVVDKLNIPANRLVLSSCSKVFERMFKTQMRERYEQTVNITALDGESVKTLIDFMYSGSITINSENVLRLLAAADYLQMEEIKTFCAEFLETILTPASCYTLLGAVNLYRLERLQNRIYHMISAKFDEFSQTDDFKSFTKADIKNCIFKLDRVQVKEVSIYKAIITWTKSDEANRSQDFPELFDMLNIDKLPRQFLKTIVSAEKLVSENLACANSVMKTLFKLLDSKPVDDASKILSIGGNTTPGQMIEVYNCEHQETTKYPALPKHIPLRGGWALKHHDHIYCIGGNLDTIKLQSADAVVQIEVHEGIRNAKKVCSMNTARSYFSAAVFCDTLVVSGGISHQGNLRLSSVECYIPQLDEWKFLAPTNYAKSSNVVVSCKGCLYDIGGSRGTTTLSTVERLCGLKEKWEFVQPMIAKRKGHAAVACNGQIYAIGGSRVEGNAEIIMKNAERYDPLSNKWVSIKDMNFCRVGHVACVLRDKIYVVGGKDAKDHCVREIECYDTDSDTWSIVGVTPVDLYNHSLVVV